VKFLAFLKTTAKKLGDQYIVGPHPKSWGDQSPPVPTVVAPMSVIHSRSTWTRLRIYVQNCWRLAPYLLQKKTAIG